MTRKSVVQFLLLSFLIPCIGFSQKVNLSLSQPNSKLIELNSGTLSIQPNSLTINKRGGITFDLWTINPAKTHVLTYKHGKDKSTIHLYDLNGLLLSTFKIIAFDKTDESLALFLTDQLLVGVRHSIGAFDFYNWDGHFINTLSNIAGSTEGEKISEFSINPNSFSFVATNPMIQMQGKKNSAAALMNPFKNEKTVIDYTNNANPIEVFYPSNTNLSVIVSSKIGGKTSIVKVVDAFGNIRNEIETDIESAIGATLDESKSFITVFSDSRMQVYQLSDEKRLGSSSVRGITLIAAFYNAKDQLLIGIQGAKNGSEISNLSTQIVHLGKRKIAKDETSNSVRFVEALPIQIKRIKSGNYIVSGLGSAIKITASF